MKRRLHISPTVAAVFLGLANAFPSIAASTTGPTTNPAVDYRQALNLLTSIRKSPSQSSLLDRYQDQKYDSQAAVFFAANEQIVELVKQAGSSSTCSWDETDLQARMDSLNGLRDLFNFVLARARFALQNNEISVAIHDALASMALARHVAMNDLIVDEMVSGSCESISTDFLASILPGLTPTQLNALLARLNDLPPVVTGAQLMTGEQTFALKRANESGVTYRIMIDGLEPLYRSIADNMEQPPDIFAKAVDTEAAKLSLNPLAKIVAPSFIGIQELMAVLSAKRDMLRTAIEISLNGPASLQSSKDAAGSGPFQYTETKAGFVLTSNLVYRGRKVTLRVGK